MIFVCFWLQKDDHLFTLYWPKEPRRVAGVYTGFIDVPSDHRASANYHVVTDSYRQNSSVATDGYIVADVNGFPQIFVGTCRFTCGKKVVHKHNSVTNETIVADCCELANESVTLHSALFPDHHVFLYFHKRTDKRVLSNLTSINICGLYNSYILAEIDISNTNW